MSNTKEYPLYISPAILEMLGPSLYTNIYYVLSELIANAYDADAHNVYIIETDKAIIVEDDGIGMSYQDVLNKYLKVAQETRTTKEESYTPSGRLRMGRKGIGKLAALAVSENVKVLTISGDEKSGFILSRKVKDGKLEPIQEEEIIFHKVKGNGTSVQMINPQYSLNKGIDTVKRNILKMFPIVNKDFKIHIIKNNKEEIIEDFDKTVISELAVLMTFGKYSYLSNDFVIEFEDIKKDILKIREPIIEKIKLKNRNGQLIDKDLIIEGWIGAYKSTRGRKTSTEEFPDNFISLFSNGKLGEFNILPLIGQNRLQEVYVVGQFFIDLFEDTDLPDMALTNRQGYKSDDIRYITVKNRLRDLLVEIVDMRERYADRKDIENRIKELENKKAKEIEFKQSVEAFTKNVANEITEKLEDIQKKEYAADLITKIIYKHSPSLSLKPIIEASKKKILISQTEADRDLSEVIYQMLIYNGVPKHDIIYTNSLDQEARIPEGYSIYKYLRDFFVESISNKKMYVIYVTSEKMSHQWGAVTEVGANWITQGAHKIFNIHPFRPKHPLDDESEWHNSIRVNNDLQMKEVAADIFCVKIEDICKKLGYKHKTRAENLKKLSSLVTIIN
ncbi:MAG TPA: ATP-binding protein [Clostridia bacterium]